MKSSNNEFVETRPRVAGVPWVEALTPYPVVSQAVLKVEDPSSVMKLDWNESTQSPPDAVIERVCDFVRGRPMQWYPDVAAETLTSALALYTGVTREQVACFNGSDAGLEYITRAYVEPGARVAMISPTYDNFRVYAQGAGGVVEFFHYDEPLNPDLSQLDRLSPGARVIYLGSPNNPTGTIYPNDVLERLLRAHPQSLVIVDEAYHEFCDQSAVSLTADYPNLIVSRTFSKAFGLAGFRIGYAVGHPEVIGVVNRIRVGKAVNALAQVAAVTALECVQDMKEYVADVHWGMSELEKGLIELGFECHPTPGNYIIVRTSDPRGFADALRERGVFIRNLGHLPGLAGCVRITVGTAVQMHELLGTIREVVSPRIPNLAS